MRSNTIRMVTTMKATDLFKAMQTRTQVYIPTFCGMMLCLINGMLMEDGSGISWIVYVCNVETHVNYKLIVRTTDKGGKFRTSILS